MEVEGSRVVQDTNILKRVLVGVFALRSWFCRYRSNLVLPLPKIAPKRTMRSSGKAMVQKMLLLLRYQLLKCPLIIV